MLHLDHGLTKVVGMQPDIRKVGGMVLLNFVTSFNSIKTYTPMGTCTSICTCTSTCTCTSACTCTSIKILFHCNRDNNKFITLISK